MEIQVESDPVTDSETEYDENDELISTVDKKINFSTKESNFC